MHHDFHNFHKGIRLFPGTITTIRCLQRGKKVFETDTELEQRKNLGCIIKVEHGEHFSIHDTSFVAFSNAFLELHDRQDVLTSITIQYMHKLHVLTPSLAGHNMRGILNMDLKVKHCTKKRVTFF